MDFNLTLVNANGEPIEEHVVSLDITEEELEAEKELFCTCDQPDKSPDYVENYLGVSHGWICKKCGKFVQIG